MVVLKMISLLLFSCFLAGPVICENGYRLNNLIELNEYTVDLTFPKEIFEGTSAVFSGVVEISFQATAKTNEIQLHHAIESISQIILLESSASVLSFELNNGSYNSTTQILTIKTGLELEVDKDYRIVIQYSANVNTVSSMGVFRTEHTNFVTDETDYFVAANFRGALARTAFPAFDEPSLKAQFTLTLNYPSELLALASTSTAETSLNPTYPKLRRTTFERTPKIAPHSLGFFVGNVTCSGTSEHRTTLISVCSKSNQGDQRYITLGIVPKILEMLEIQTGVDHNLPNLALIALPSDFLSKGVTNLGMILLPEHECLNTETGIVSARVENGFIIAKSVARHWFGTILTPKWWDYNFISEGLAQWYAYHVLEQLDFARQWNAGTRFFSNVVSEAFILDSDRQTKELTYRTSTPNEIITKFDDFNSKKGSSLFHMVKNVMGQATFLSGIKVLLENCSSTGVDTDQLWNILNHYTPSDSLPRNIDLKTVMSNWTDEPGHPIVLTRRVNPTHLEYTARRFTYNGLYRNPSGYIPKEVIPLDNREKLNESRIIWLRSNTILSNVKDKGIFEDKWFGFYRTKEDHFTFQMILKTLDKNHVAVDVKARTQLISNVLNLARGGQLSYHDALNLTEYLINEKEFYPWYTFLKDTGYVLKRLGPEARASKALKNYISKILSRRYSEIDFTPTNGEDVNFDLMHELVLYTECIVLAEPKCVAKAREISETRRKTGKSLPRNLRSLIKATDVKYSDNAEADFQYHWDDFLKSDTATKRNNILAILGYANDEAVIKKFLAYTIDSKYHIKGDEFASIWKTVASNQPLGTETALTFLTDHYEEVSSVFSRTDLLITDIADFFYRRNQIRLLDNLLLLQNLSMKDIEATHLAKSKVIENIAWARLVADDIYLYRYHTESLGLRDSLVTTAYAFLLVGVLSSISALVYLTILKKRSSKLRIELNNIENDEKQGITTDASFMRKLNLQDVSYGTPHPLGNKKQVIDSNKDIM